MPSHPVVQAAGLRVSFPSRRGEVEALKGVDMDLPKGSLFVLLGPNGAGKTTLMRCITSLVRPTSGHILVFGGEEAPKGGSGTGPGLAGAGSPDRPERLRRIGILIENPGVYSRLDAREYLAFFGSFYGMGDLDARIDELCGGFGLALDGKPVGKLSQGNRQKLQLVRSLLHSPELLLWDEPTDHLDPEAQAKVLGYLRSYLAGTGATALIATHRLEQMEGLGTHFGFLRSGRLALAGTRDAILGSGESRVRVGFAQPVAPDRISPIADRLGLSVSVAVSSSEPDRLPDRESASADFSGPGLEAALPALVKALALADLPIKAVMPLRSTLAEIYGKVMAA